jgi:hypothetical protein
MRRKEAQLRIRTAAGGAYHLVIGDFSIY